MTFDPRMHGPGSGSFLKSLGLIGPGWSGRKRPGVTKVSKEEQERLSKLKIKGGQE